MIVHEPRTTLRRVLWVLALTALIPLIPFAIIGELPGDRFLLANGQSAATFGAVGAGLLALDVLLPIPSSILAALLGARLGIALGFLCSFIGLFVGHVVGYQLGKLWPQRAQDAELPGAPTFSLVLLTRPVPVLAEAVAISAGALRVPFARFALAAALGDGLYAAVMAANGAALLPDGMVGPGLILPLLLPVAAWFAFRFYRRKQAAAR